MRGVRHGACPNEEVSIASSFFDAMCWKGSKKMVAESEIGLRPGPLFTFLDFFLEFCYFHGFSYIKLIFSWFKSVPGTPKSDGPNRRILRGIP